MLQGHRQILGKNGYGPVFRPGHNAHRKILLHSHRLLKHEIPGPVRDTEPAHSDDLIDTIPALKHFSRLQTDLYLISGIHHEPLSSQSNGIEPVHFFPPDTHDMPAEAVQQKRPRLP